VRDYELYARRRRRRALILAAVGWVCLALGAAVLLWLFVTLVLTALCGSVC
jgi:uncharacterized membrane protein YdbT with pleckstrin-like domain